MADTDAWTDSHVLLNLLIMIKNLAGVIPGRLPSGQRVHYHILTLSVNLFKFLLAPHPPA